MPSPNPSRPALRARPVSLWRLILCPLCALVLLTACSKEQAQQLADSVTAKTKELVDDPSKVMDEAKALAQSAADKVSDAAPALEGVLPSDGEATIEVGEPVEVGTALVRILPVGTRGNIVQIRSYAKPSEEKLPAFLFQAKTDSLSLTSLAGQELEGSLFFQAEKDGPVWFCAADQRVKLSVTQLDEEGHLVGQWSGKLVSSTGEASEVHGSVTAKNAE